jgi:hypothetical protein
MMNSESFMHTKIRFLLFFLAFFGFSHQNYPMQFLMRTSTQQFIWPAVAAGGTIGSVVFFTDPYKIIKIPWVKVIGGTIFCGIAVGSACKIPTVFEAIYKHPGDTVFVSLLGSCFFGLGFLFYSKVRLN